MIVAIFADHASAQHVALLAARALNRDDAADEVLGRVRDGRELGPEEIVTFLDDAAEGEGHAVVTLSRAGLSDPMVRRMIDLPVVLAGAGASGFAAAMAAVDGSQDCADLAPPWLLAGEEETQRLLRRLPCRLPSIRADDVLRLRSGSIPPSLTRFSLALAASLHVAAADPTAVAIPTGRVRQVVTDPKTSAERDLRIDLLAIAADLTGLPPDLHPLPAAARPERSARRRDARRRGIPPTRPERRPALGFGH